MLYFDEVEICNPIGSNRKKHKLGNWYAAVLIMIHFFNVFAGCFYFSLANIPPRFRSTLNSIQLIALINNQMLRQYGMNKALERLMEDVCRLEKVCIIILFIMYILCNHKYCSLDMPAQ